jgi:hypothetical protein
VLVLKLPDGQQLVADEPSLDVQAAVRRMAAALAKGRQPRRSDARLVRLWLASQDERHGGVERHGEGRAAVTRRPAFDVPAALAYAELRRRTAAGPVVRGQRLLAALAARGLRVRLGPDGGPRPGPRELVDGDTVALLAGHRDDVVAALRHGADR